MENKSWKTILYGTNIDCPLNKYVPGRCAMSNYPLGMFEMDCTACNCKLNPDGERFDKHLYLNEEEYAKSGIKRIFLHSWNKGCNAEALSEEGEKIGGGYDPSGYGKDWCGINNHYRWVRKYPKGFKTEIAFVDNPKAAYAMCEAGYTEVKPLGQPASKTVLKIQKMIKADIGLDIVSFVHRSGVSQWSTHVINAIGERHIGLWSPYSQGDFLKSKDRTYIIEGNDIVVMPFKMTAAEIQERREERKQYAMKSISYTTRKLERVFEKECNEPTNEAALNFEYNAIARELKPWAVEFGWEFKISEGHLFISDPQVTDVVYAE